MGISFRYYMYLDLDYRVVTICLSQYLVKFKENGKTYVYSSKNIEIFDEELYIYCFFSQ